MIYLKLDEGALEGVSNWLLTGSPDQNRIRENFARTFILAPFQPMCSMAIQKSPSIGFVARVRGGEFSSF